jgi:tryptophanyl-tRNA synthetase
MGLDDPTSKMSKSESAPGHAIGLLDSPDEVRAKLKRAATDSSREIRFDENRPGVNNLLVIYEAFTGQEREDIEARFEGKGYADLKNDLSDAVIEGIRPLQEKYRQIEKEPGHLYAMLKECADKVRPIADSTLRLVMERVGLG